MRESIQNRGFDFILCVNQFVPADDPPQISGIRKLNKKLA